MNIVFSKSDYQETEKIPYYCVTRETQDGVNLCRNYSYCNLDKLLQFIQEILVSDDVKSFEISKINT